MKKNSLPNVRVIPAIFCLIIALLFVAAPAMATGTTNITVTKYHDNNYSAVENSTTLNLAALQGLSAVASGGPLGMQGGTFNYGLDLWAYTPDSMAYFGEQNGTYVRDITDQVGGMSVGDEIWVVASDGYKTYFNYTNVYAPHVNQSEMILSWKNGYEHRPHLRGRDTALLLHAERLELYQCGHARLDGTVVLEGSL